jgi:LacI family transcriptional regulator
LAGVSPSVVSYVLNGGPRGVAPGTRSKVLAAIEQLGYRPNGIARSLRTSRTMTLGLVIPDSSNPFFAELARAIEEAAFDAGYTLLVGNATEDAGRQTTYIRTFLERQVDGLLLVPAHGPVECLLELRSSIKPCVVLDRRVDHLGLSQVLVDSRGGAREVTRHLLDRVAGWRDALAGAGLRPTGTAIRHVPFGRGAGYRAACDLLGSGAHHPDAIFVASDEQALGALRALADLGMRCPDDVAVASFDGIASSAYAVPALTTMAQPFLRLGRCSIASLITCIADPGTEPEEAVLPVSLVARGSCGCADPSGEHSRTTTPA